MSDTAPRIALRHRIAHRFDRPVRLSTHWLRLAPAPQTRATITAYSLHVEPQSAFLNWLRDPFENHLARLDFPEPVTACVLDVELLAELTPVNPFDFLVDPGAAEHPFDYPEQLAGELAPYLLIPTTGNHVTAWLEQLDHEPAPVTQRLMTLAQQLSQTVTITHNAGHRIDPDAVLAQGTGSPLELAWLLTLALRSLNLASRVVSGYRITGTAGDYHGELHAWSEVYLPGAGWLGIDPATGLLTAEQHIPLTCAPDPLRLRPVLGYREACEESTAETIRVQTLRPRKPSWPYTTAQWQQIQSAASRVDAHLNAEALALTNAPELEFTRTDHKDLPEWRTTGLGRDKVVVGERLVRQLRDEHLPGGILITGQGEWFAGEPAPRWQRSCIARGDGVPLWQHPHLLGGPGNGGAATPHDLQHLAQGLSNALGLTADDLIPAYEDQLYQLWLDRDTLDYQPQPTSLDTPEARLALAQQLSRSRSRPSGYVLPLYRDPDSGNWLTGPWPTRRERLELIPGDSPIGFRLPLGSLPRGATNRKEPTPQTSPWERLTPLVQPPPAPPRVQPTERVMSTTALCLELRQQQLHVFLPPLPCTEDFIALVQTLEQVAVQAQLPLHLEGYQPPPDPRLRRLTVEPATGTLRVTLPPLHDWASENQWLESTYTAAAELGLSAETGDTDTPAPVGQRAGQRLGGPTPDSSPFLQQPGLLRSMLQYWHRHPSLSYLFAGPRIGPDGWAPRLDEASETHLYELGLALERIPDGVTARPWLLDRVLSHLVTDPSGDPRGGEFRLDRLYPPATDAARLGEVGLYAFCMAPHPHMAAVQSLLLRAITAHLATTPEHGPLHSWGTALHDRFMLPRLLEDDFRTVLKELAASGHSLPMDWFLPFVERRFPLLADQSMGPVRFRLRPAQEPWPVLAEAATGGGTMRFVDPATARFQVELTGFTPGRHLLLCNGHMVPLQPTGTRGSAVAGVRCKVTDPPATLYPGVPAVEALVFDLLDHWTGEVLGGCTYEPPAWEPWTETPRPTEPHHPLVPGAPATMQAAPAATPQPPRRRGRVQSVGSTTPPPPQEHGPDFRDAPYLLDLSAPLR